MKSDPTAVQRLLLWLPNGEVSFTFSESGPDVDEVWDRYHNFIDYYVTRPPCDDPVKKANVPDCWASWLTILKPIVKENHPVSFMLVTAMAELLAMEEFGRFVLPKVG